LRNFTDEATSIGSEPFDLVSVDAGPSALPPVIHRRQD
jgi:hypothetical protein